MKSNAGISVASRCVVNPDNYKVIFYLGNSNGGSVNFNVGSGGNTRVNASMYIPNGTLAVSGDGNNTTNMTGKFIAGQVSSGSRVTWNSFDCASAPAITTNTLDVDQAVTKEIPDEQEQEMTVQVMPNPSQSYFTLVFKSSSDEAAEIKVYDMAGRQVDQKRGAKGESIRFGGQLVQGMYIVEVRQGTNQKLLKVIKN